MGFCCTILGVCNILAQENLNCRINATGFDQIICRMMVRYVPGEPCDQPAENSDSVVKFSGGESQGSSQSSYAANVLSLIELMNQARAQLGVAVFARQ